MLNDFVVKGQVAYLKLRHRDGSHSIAKVDATALPKLKALNIRFSEDRRRSGKRYAACKRRGQPKVYLHQVILGKRPGFWIDHRDGDGLDCRRRNLRHAPPTLNLINKGTRRDNKNTGVKNVHKITGSKKFRAEFQFQNKQTYLGAFDTIEDAALAVYSKLKRIDRPSARTYGVHLKEVGVI